MKAYREIQSGHWFKTKGKTLIVKAFSIDLHLFWTLPEQAGSRLVNTAKDLESNAVLPNMLDITESILIETGKQVVITDIPEDAVLFLSDQEDGASSIEYPAYICFQD